MKGSVLLPSSIELQKLMSLSGFFLERTVGGAQSLGSGHLNGGFLLSFNGILSCTMLGGFWK